MELKSIHPDQIEIRGFMQLDAQLRKRFGSKPPYFMKLEKSMTGLELSKLLDIDRDDIEIIFVNRLAKGVQHVIKPGDRVGFLPPGCPGPYRIALGFYSKNQDNEANFRIQKKKK